MIALLTIIPQESQDEITKWSTGWKILHYNPSSYTDKDSDIDTDKSGDKPVKASSAEIEEKDTEQMDSPSSLPGNNDIELADEQIDLNAAVPSDKDTAISSQNCV